jgi:sortase A
MRDHARIWLERGLFALGTGLLAWSLWAAGDGCAWQMALSQRLASLVTRDQTGLSGGVAVAARREASGSGLVGRVEIPRLRLSAMIVEGTTPRALRRGVGHVEHTAFPGERDNVGLAGHRDTFFRNLGRVRKGDLIRLRTPDGNFTYRVNSMAVVGPDRSDLLGHTHHAMVTLVTCYPFGWVGPAPDRFVVRASSVRQPAEVQHAEVRHTVVAPSNTIHARVAPALAAGSARKPLT